VERPDVPTKALLVLVRKLAGEMQIWLSLLSQNDNEVIKKQTMKMVTLMHKIVVQAELIPAPLEFCPFCRRSLREEDKPNDDEVA
jgi:hypothetical protein